MPKIISGAGALCRISLAAVWLMTVPAVATAQEECELVGSEATNSAAEALQAAQAAADREAALPHYSDAYASLERYLGGDDPAVFLLAANAKIGLREFADAHTLLTQFIQIAPECGKVATETRYSAWVDLYNMAIQAYQEGDTETALGHFEVANVMYKDIRAFNNAALLYVEQGDTEAAIETYRSGLEVDGDQESLAQLVAGLGDLLISTNRAGEAIEAYEGYLEKFPTDVVVQISYAMALSDEGRGDEATAIFGEILGRTDLTDEQWVVVGVGLYNAGDYERSRGAFGNARAANPYNKEAMENYVNASVQAGNAEPVLALADTLISWYPYDNANYQLLASALAKADQDQRAMGVLQDGESTDVVFHSVQIAEVDSGSYVVRGILEVRESAGGGVQIPFEFLGADGTVVASESLSMSAAVGAREPFDLNVSSAVPIMGFRYGKSGS
jgi:tetratricopeptide (TPR) repeat protein